MISPPDPVAELVLLLTSLPTERILKLYAALRRLGELPPHECSTILSNLDGMTFDHLLAAVEVGS